MGKKQILLLLTLSMLALLSGVYVVGGAEAYSRFRQNSLADQEHCGGQVPPHVCVFASSAIFNAFYSSYVAIQYPLFKVNYTTQISTCISPPQGQVLRNLTTDQDACATHIGPMV